ncbi:hypothetical protein AACH06_02830 [Ideonella sp. DXS29W]|uniref:DUF2946 domain-containing protein n=1 Tax=Ideonella lacteola TaxID=2984193 RepID=A0ABU9BKY8_9BURK
MRFVRVLLLVMLAAMLPLRGVMAAAMMCSPHGGADVVAHHMPAAGGASPAHGEAHTEADAHDHAHQHDDAGRGAGAQPEHHHEGGSASPLHHHDGAPGTDSCNLCSACCSVPPVPSAAPVVPLPREPAAAVFPTVQAPAPTFQSEGPERPPRSI